jgi:hypothetical protein
MKIRHAIAFGLLVVGLSVTYVLYQRSVETEMLATVAATTIVVATVIAGSGKCCIGKRCFGKGKNDNMEPWPHWLWF